MEHTTILEQAKTMAALLPALMRQLFAGENGLAAKLPLAQLKVCGAIYVGSRPMSDLGRELGVSQSAMTQIADRLEREGLARRVAAEDDRRIRCLQLTDRGEKMMRLRESARVQRASSVLARLAPAARRDVLAALQTLIGACGAAGEKQRHRSKSRSGATRKGDLGTKK
jgi:DNA-binding MarR family transcriptional regulator